MSHAHTSQPQLQDIVQRILSVHPRARIVLFGSRAHGSATAHSDYDLVVITPDLRADEPPAARVRKALRGVDASFDLIVLTPQEWESCRAVRGSVLRAAADTGLVLHAAA